MSKKYHKNIPASYLIITKGKKVLLLRRFNTGYEDGKYSLIAGHVEKGETFSDCIIREAKEESGISIKNEDLKVVHVLHRNSGLNENNERVDIFFKVEKWEGQIENKEPDKCDDLSWFDIDNLPLNTIPYISHVLENFKQNIFYSEFGWDI